MKEKDIGHSRPLDVYKWSDWPEIDKGLINQLARELGLETPCGWSNGPGATLCTPKQRKHLKVVVLDLYIANKVGVPWVAYSRTKNDYNKESRYNKLHIGYTPLIKVIDSLKKLGYIEHAIGFYDRSTGFGYQSRMRATKKLIKLIETRKVKHFMIRKHELEEVILLKDKERKLVEYEDTAITYLMRMQLQIINQYLSRSLIDLDISDKELEELEQRIVPIDLSRVRLKRIFNNGSFEEGGRFYCGWWQDVPKEYRQSIIINRDKTVELDYAGMHFRMLYATEGLEPPEDPYHLPKLGKRSYRRDTIKQATNILLNASSRQSANRAIAQEYPMVDKARLVAAILERHKPIADFFFTGVGIQLQYWDSVIAEQVMLRMYEEHAEPCLPVHDSFIVRESKAGALRHIMEEAFNHIYPTAKAVIKGNTNMKPAKETMTKEGYIIRERVDNTPLDYAKNPKAAARRKMLLERVNENRRRLGEAPIHIHTKW